MKETPNGSLVASFDLRGILTGGACSTLDPFGPNLLWTDTSKLLSTISGSPPRGQAEEKPTVSPSYSLVRSGNSACCLLLRSDRSTSMK